MGHTCVNKHAELKVNHMWSSNLEQKRLHGGITAWPSDTGSNITEATANYDNFLIFKHYCRAALIYLSEYHRNNHIATENELDYYSEQLSSSLTEASHLL